jgi:hypothetical protein
LIYKTINNNYNIILKRSDNTPAEDTDALDNDKLSELLNTNKGLFTDQMAPMAGGSSRSRKHRRRHRKKNKNTKRRNRK